MALSYNFGYQESISVHPTRRQIFAGKPDSTFPNIWEWLISVCPSGQMIDTLQICNFFPFISLCHLSISRDVLKIQSENILLQNFLFKGLVCLLTLVLVDFFPFKSLCYLIAGILNSKNENFEKGTKCVEENCYLPQCYVCLLPFWQFLSRHDLRDLCHREYPEIEMKTGI